MSEPPWSAEVRRGVPQRADPETRREVEAALAARRELGADYEESIAAGLAERVEQLVSRRTPPPSPVRSGPSKKELEAEGTARRQRFVLGIVSVTAGIPITAIAGALVDPGLIGIAVSWAGIVGVNVAHAWGSRKDS